MNNSFTWLVKSNPIKQEISGAKIRPPMVRSFSLWYHWSIIVNTREPYSWLYELSWWIGVFPMVRSVLCHEPLILRLAASWASASGSSWRRGCRWLDSATRRNAASGRNALFVLTHNARRPTWPDVGIISSPIFTTSCTKSSQSKILPKLTAKVVSKFCRRGKISPNLVTLIGY